MAQPEISIIIPCFNCQKYLKSCLGSILVSDFSNYEIIVVDDGSTDGSRKLLKELNSKLPPRHPALSKERAGSSRSGISRRVSKADKREHSPASFAENEWSSYAPSLKVVFNKKNLGAAQSRNIGARAARGKYLFFLDADTEIDKACLGNITKAFQNHPQIGAIQTKLLLGHTSKIDTIGHFLSPWGLPYELGHSQHKSTYDQEQLIFAGRTAGLAIRRKVFDKIGGFDKDYLIYGEDTDLCWRVWLAGYQVVFLPQAKVRHFAKSSLTKKTYQRIFFEGAKNHLQSILKNASRKTLIWLVPANLVGWLAITFALLIQGRIISAAKIWQGILWNCKNFHHILEKRKKVISFRQENNQAETIMFGQTSLTHLLLKGWRWLKNV